MYTAPAAGQLDNDQPGRSSPPIGVIHYTIYLPDGFSLSSHETGAPFRFYMYSESVLPGLAEAVSSMEIGETRRIHLTPERAFGSFDPRNVLEVSREKLFAEAGLSLGQPVRLTVNGGLRQAFVREQRPDSVVFDLNHPLAGLEITMDVTLIGYE